MNDDDDVFIQSIGMNIIISPFFRECTQQQQQSNSSRKKILFNILAKRFFFHYIFPLLMGGRFLNFFLLVKLVYNVQLQRYESGWVVFLVVAILAKKKEMANHHPHPPNFKLFVVFILKKLYV